MDLHPARADLLCRASQARTCGVATLFHFLYHPLCAVMYQIFQERAHILLLPADCLPAYR